MEDWNVGVMEKTTICSFIHYSIILLFHHSTFSQNLTPKPIRVIRFALDTSPSSLSPNHDACFTAGIFHVPSMIDGVFSLGQYMRSIRMNFSFAAGSQFASLSLPGDSFWI